MSGFDTPKEQWTYSIKRYTGVFHYVLEPFTKLFIAFKYGTEQNLSAVDGINSVHIPILVISGAEDEFYGGDSPIYKRRYNITNPNCSFEYKTGTNHNGHYDYFLTDDALEYQSSVKSKTFSGQFDRECEIMPEKPDYFPDEQNYDKYSRRIKVLLVKP